MKRDNSPITESLTINQRMDLIESRLIRVESRLEQVERQTQPPAVTSGDKLSGKMILKAMANISDGKNK